MKHRINSYAVKPLRLLNSPAEIKGATLHFTNTNELSHCYNYLILKIGVYAQSSTDQWEKASGGNGEPIPDIFITLRNGQVSFSTPGYAKYKVTIDSGCFYCTTANTDGGSVSPQFHLTVN